MTEIESIMKELDEKYCWFLVKPVSDRLIELSAMEKKLCLHTTNIPGKWRQMNAGIVKELVFSVVEVAISMERTSKRDTPLEFMPGNSVENAPFEGIVIVAD